MNNLDSLSENPYLDYKGEEVNDSIDIDWAGEIENLLPKELNEPNTRDCHGCGRQFEADLDPEADYCPSCIEHLPHCMEGDL